MRPGHEISISQPGIDIVFHNQPAQDWGKHRHDRHELIIPLAGEIICRSADADALVVRRGEMLWIELGTDHSVKSKDVAGERLILLMNDDFWCAARKGISVTSGNQLLVELAMWLIFRQDLHTNPTILAALKSVIAVLGVADSIVLTEQSRLDMRIRDERLRKAQQYIVHHIDEELRVGDVAKAAGASERTLDRLVASELGISVGEMIRKIRMDEAMGLLQNGCTVTETALKVGYQSLSQFIRVFQLATGRLPSDYLR